MASSQGSIETTEITPPESIRDAVATCGQHVWRPSQQLQSKLPEGFALTIWSTTDQSGTRRFQPPDWGPFLVLAACGGLAVKQSSGPIESERLFSYRISQLIFQLHARMRSTLTRVFVREKDLYVSRSASEDGAAHIIPTDLWSDEIIPGAEPTPTRLMKTGEYLADKADLEHPDAATLIHLSLDDAARRRPVAIADHDEAELRQIVRLGLFAPRPADQGIADDVRDEVIRRFTESLEKHIDLPTDEFNRWFFDHLDNIVKQISERKGEIGPVDRQVVSQVILEQVFESCVHLAGLVEAQMRAFAAALPIPLTSAESEMYEAIYDQQTWLGGPSVAMLAGQFPLLRSLLGELIAEPTDPVLQGAILRRLQINAEMVDRKRTADTNARRRQRAGLRGQSTMVEVTAPSESPLLQEIAVEIRERRNLACECQSWGHWHAEEFSFSGDQSGSGSVSWRDGCATCDHVEEVTIDRDEFAEVYHLVSTTD